MNQTAQLAKTAWDNIETKMKGMTERVSVDAMLRISHNAFPGHFGTKHVARSHINACSIQVFLNDLLFLW
mgnify:CR=1 FL=1